MSNKLTQKELFIFNWFMDHVEQDLEMGLDCNFAGEFEGSTFPKKWIRSDGCVDVDKIFHHIRQKVTKLIT